MQYKPKVGIKVLRTDYKEELERGLKEVVEEIEKSLINGDKDKAFQQLNKKLRSLVGIDIDTVDLLYSQDIIDIVGRENQHNADRYVALGELLSLYGTIYERIDNEEKKLEMYEKSLKSFYEAYMEEESLEDKYMMDALKVVECVAEYEVGFNDNKLMFRLYEAANKLDKAEDILYEMLKQSENSKEVIQLGEDFYNRLKEKTNEELQKGNLPIEEVEDGLKSLEKLL